MGFDGLLTGLGQALSGRPSQAHSPAIPRGSDRRVSGYRPVQYRIFDRLYPANEAGLGLIMIGDPKQAIYAFRQRGYLYLSAGATRRGRPGL